MKNSGFPPATFNLRIETQIDHFFKDLKALFLKKKWKWEAVDFNRDIPRWRHPDCTIEVRERYANHKYKRIDVTFRRLPGFIRPEFKLSAVRFEHHYQIVIPQEYPRHLGRVRLLSLSGLYHPRFHQGTGTGEICMAVNGEIDRILWDLLFTTLMRVDRIRPPKIYKTDSGLNPSAMRWYERNMNKIQTFLSQLWEEQHPKTLTTNDDSQKINKPKQRRKLKILS